MITLSKKVRALACLTVASLSMSSCSCMHTKSVPAQALQHSEKAQQELQSIISSALGQKTVQLSLDIFIGTSDVAFEKADLTGRGLEEPTRFRLLMKNEHCVLARLDGEKKILQKWALNEVQCLAAP